MAHLGALLIFLALSGTCWVVSVALYRGTVGGPDPAAAPAYRPVAAAAVAAALTSFLPLPHGYLGGLVGWAAAAVGGLGLPPGRAAVLFLYLAASSFVSRLAVRGFMDLFGI